MSDAEIVARFARKERARGIETPIGLHYLGVDVGWVFPAADSDGNVYEWTKCKVPDIHLARAGPVTVHKADGQTFVQAAYSRAEASTALARGDKDKHRNVAQRIVTLAKRTNRTLVLENWMEFSRRKTAWVGMWSMIERVADRRNVPVTQVNRAYTSITCPRCGHKDRGNRETRDRFRCLVCDFSGHADVIAAMNIAAKAAGLFRMAEQRCCNPACVDGVVWAAGLCSHCYHFRRNHGALPSKKDVRARKEEPAAERYRALRQREVHAERQGRREATAKARMAESYRTHDAWGNPLDATSEGH